MDAAALCRSLCSRRALGICIFGSVCSWHCSSLTRRSVCPLTAHSLILRSASAAPSHLVARCANQRASILTLSSQHSATAVCLVRIRLFVLQIISMSFPITFCAPSNERTNLGASSHSQGSTAVLFGHSARYIRVLLPLDARQGPRPFGFLCRV